MPAPTPPGRGQGQIDGGGGVATGPHLGSGSQGGARWPVGRCPWRLAQAHSIGISGPFLHFSSLASSDTWGGMQKETSNVSSCGTSSACRHFIDPQATSPTRHRPCKIPGGTFRISPRGMILEQPLLGPERAAPFRRCTMGAVPSGRTPGHLTFFCPQLEPLGPYSWRTPSGTGRFSTSFQDPGRTGTGPAGAPAAKPLPPGAGAHRSHQVRRGDH